MKILVASDHAGFELKNAIVALLKSQGVDVEDMGAKSFDESDDYPTIMIPVAMQVASDPENTKAIILGKSGNGEAMVSNRFPGVRAAVYHGKNMEIVRLSREHNDANILSLAAGYVDEKEACEAVTLWLATPFSEDERHIRRNEMLDSIE
jgi:ribose 5-phosphate isomerase B